MLATHHRQRSCAVLAPVFRDRSDELRVLLVRRGMRGIPGGRLGFPGGDILLDSDQPLWGVTLRLLDPVMGPLLEGAWAI
jgi:8-oxo-dGTP pyrophosphatase MutT (NUDIX family)